MTNEKLEQIASGNGGLSESNWIILIKFTGVSTKFFEEKTYDLQVTPETTVLELKQMIKNKEGIDPEGQILVLIGKQLFEPNTLVSSGAVNGSVINLLVKVRYM